MRAPRTALITGMAVLALAAGCSRGTAGDAALAAGSTTTSPASTTTGPVPATTTAPSTTTGATTTIAPTTPVAVTTAAAPTCGVDLEAPAITDAVAQLRPAFTDPDLADVAWYPVADGGNYDPCATLSAATVTVEGATGGSPEQVLMFHDGVYQGTGTFEAYGFTTVDVGASTNDTVVVDYRYLQPGESTATASGLVTIRYQWVDGAVRMLDTLPPEITS